MAKVSRVRAREVLDSRGNPTVEAVVWCDDGSHGQAIVPSGASTGSSEAHELRDQDPDRYDGQGVLRAVEHVRDEISPRVVGQDVMAQAEIDGDLLELDGTERKTRLGANAILGVSLAVAHAAAESLRVPLYRYLAKLAQDIPNASVNSASADLGPRLPVPMTNMISGGLHAGGNLDFQDYLVMPVGAPNYRTGLEWIVRVYRRLGVLLADIGYSSQLVGDEGGYGPKLADNRQALELLTQAVEAADLRPGIDVTLALDVAATHFHRDGQYMLLSESGSRLDSSGMIDKLEKLSDEFPVTSIEDGLAEEDWTGWQSLTARLGDRALIVGDDLLTTNPKRVKKAIDRKAANAVLVKVNQIGTLTEALEVMAMARAAGFRLVVSARSGETEDTTIADLAVAWGAEHIKIGSITRGERLAKYNRLLRIEEEIASCS